MLAVEKETCSKVSTQQIFWKKQYGPNPPIGAFIPLTVPLIKIPLTERAEFISPNQIIKKASRITQVTWY